MPSYQIRIETFKSESFPQGYGLKWEDIPVVVELDEDEEVFCMDTYMTAAPGFDGMAGVIRAWIRKRLN